MLLGARILMWGLAWGWWDHRVPGATSHGQHGSTEGIGTGMESGLQANCRVWSCWVLWRPCVMGSQMLGRVLVVYVDNQGAVDIYRKGTSTRCVYTSTVSKACYDLSLMLGGTLLVEKVRRCSDAGSYLADMISKGNLVQFRQLMPDRKLVTELPMEFIRWVMDPVEDLDLGWRIAAELSVKYPDIVLLK